MTLLADSPNVPSRQGFDLPFGELGLSRKHGGGEGLGQHDELGVDFANAVTDVEQPVLESNFGRFLNEKRGVKKSVGHSKASVNATTEPGLCAVSGVNATGTAVPNSDFTARDGSLSPAHNETGEACPFASPVCPTPEL